MDKKVTEVCSKITMEGEDEYIRSLYRIKDSVQEFREEVEQLNTALEKEIELLNRLR